MTILLAELSKVDGQFDSDIGLLTWQPGHYPGCCLCFALVGTGRTLDEHPSVLLLAVDIGQLALWSRYWPLPLQRPGAQFFRRIGSGWPQVRGRRDTLDNSNLTVTGPLVLATADSQYRGASGPPSADLGDVDLSLSLR